MIIINIMNNMNIMNNRNTKSIMISKVIMKTPLVYLSVPHLDRVVPEARHDLRVVVLKE